MKTSIAIVTAMLAVTGLARTSLAADTGKVCPKNILPVCALNSDGTRATFNNSCEAERAGATVLHDGRCHGTMCSMIVKPVCATDPKTGKERTYGNLCFAEHANAKYVRAGRCD
jgi:hypothetical protein